MTWVSEPSKKKKKKLSCHVPLFIVKQCGFMFDSVGETFKGDCEFNRKLLRQSGSQGRLIDVVNELYLWVYGCDQSNERYRAVLFYSVVIWFAIFNKHDIQDISVHACMRACVRALWLIACAFSLWGTTIEWRAQSGDNLLFIDFWHHAINRARFQR